MERKPQDHIPLKVRPQFKVGQYVQLATAKKGTVVEAHEGYPEIHYVLRMDDGTRVHCMEADLTKAERQRQGATAFTAEIRRK